MSAPGDHGGFAFRIFPEHKLAVVVAEGAFTTIVLAEAMIAIYKAAQWSPGFNILWDIERITKWSINWEDTEGFVDLDRELAALSGDGKDVVLSANDLHLTNIEAYATLSRDNPRAVIPTRTVEAAAAQLQVDHIELRRLLESLAREL